MRKIVMVVLMVMAVLMGSVGFAQRKMSTLECVALEMELFEGQVVGGACSEYPSTPAEMEIFASAVMTDNGFQLEERRANDNFRVQTWYHPQVGASMTLQVRRGVNTVVIIYDYIWFRYNNF